MQNRDSSKDTCFKIQNNTKHRGFQYISTSRARNVIILQFFYFFIKTKYIFLEEKPTLAQKVKITKLQKLLQS